MLSYASGVQLLERNLKTRMIPIGTVAYRKHVVETRKISPEQPELPAHVNIAKDGSATRILGAWLGNAIDQISVWTPTLEKIKKSLDNWRKSFPTLEGKKRIIQMTVAVQYKVCQKRLRNV